MTTGDWSGLLPGVLLVGGGYILFLLIKIFRIVSEMSEWQRARHEELIWFIERSKSLPADADGTGAAEDPPPHN